jgi:hypothetical protein
VLSVVAIVFALDTFSSSVYTHGWRYDPLSWAAFALSGGARAWALLAAGAAALAAFAVLSRMSAWVSHYYLRRCASRAVPAGAGVAAKS